MLQKKETESALPLLPPLADDGAIKVSPRPYPTQEIQQDALLIKLEGTENSLWARQLDLEHQAFLKKKKNIFSAAAKFLHKPLHHSLTQNSTNSG